MKKLTKKAIKEYLWSSDHCPYCKSVAISSGEFEPEGYYMEVHCEDCKKSWNEVFELTTIESIES